MYILFGSPSRDADADARRRHHLTFACTALAVIVMVATTLGDRSAHAGAPPRASAATRAPIAVPQGDPSVPSAEEMLRVGKPFEMIDPPATF